MRMLFRPSALAAAALLLTACSTPTRQASAPDPQLAQIGQIVVVYLENRSFDHLFGLYPGANGVPNALAQGLGVQVDANNQPYAVLPPPLADKTGKPDARLAGPIPNGPFRLDPKIGLGDTLFSPIHAFWANQRQINGGRNDRFVADGNSGGLLMGTYDGSSLGLWKLAQRFTLADNFFQSAFGGSFLNHFWLVCACTPVYANAPHHIVALDAQGRSAEPDEPEAYVTQDGYAVNTMQGSWLYDPTKKQALLPPQTAPTPLATALGFNGPLADAALPGDALMARLIEQAAAPAAPPEAAPAASPAAPVVTPVNVPQVVRRRRGFAQVATALALMVAGGFAWQMICNFAIAHSQATRAAAQPAAPAATPRPAAVTGPTNASTPAGQVLRED